MLGPERRTHFSVGSYPRGEAGKVASHAAKQGIAYETIQGPRDNFPLADDSRISVPEGQIAVVLITTDIGVVNRFWDGFEFPEGT